jgi:hypothetical protein
VPIELTQKELDKIMKEWTYLGPLNPAKELPDSKIHNLLMLLARTKWKSAPLTLDKLAKLTNHGIMLYSIQVYYSSSVIHGQTYILTLAAIFRFEIM